MDTMNPLSHLDLSNRISCCYIRANEVGPDRCLFLSMAGAALFDTRSGACLYRSNSGDYRDFCRADSGTVILFQKSGEIDALDVNSGQITQSTRLPTALGHASVIAPNPYGYLLAAGDNGVIYWFDKSFTSGACKWKSGVERIYGVTRQNEFVLAKTWSGDFTVCDLRRSGKPLMVGMSNGNPNFFVADWCIVDGIHFISMHHDGNIQHRDLYTGKIIQKVIAHPQFENELWPWLHFIRINPTTLATAAMPDHRIILWDLPSLRVKQVLDQHHSPVDNLAIAHDGTLRSLHLDKINCAWDIEKGELKNNCAPHDFYEHENALPSFEDDPTFRPLCRMSNGLIAGVHTIDINRFERRQLEKTLPQDLLAGRADHEIVGEVGFYPVPCEFLSK